MLSICSCIARRTSGWPWPRHDTAAPPDASMYSLPAVSTMRTPWPAARDYGVDGWRGIGRLADRDQNIARTERVDLIVHGPADAVEEHAVASDQVVRVAKLEGDAEGCPHAEKAHTLGGSDRADGRFELLRGVERQHGLDVRDLRGRD